MPRRGAGGKINPECMSITEALKEIEDSPGFFDHVADLQQSAKAEQQRREQFYRDIDEDTKAEFINGQVVMHSPVRRRHLQASLNVAVLLRLYVGARNLGDVYTEKCMIRCQRNDYEPDMCFFGTVKCAQLTDDQLLFPSPDLIVEVLSPSTERNDRTVKLHDYARHGVSEYWIIDADARTVEAYALAPNVDGYVLRARLAVGEQLTSGAALPGFAVPVAALFDPQEHQRALSALLASA